jgi:hypothetical protein
LFGLPNRVNHSIVVKAVFEFLWVHRLPASSRAASAETSAPARKPSTGESSSSS